LREDVRTENARLEALEASHGPKAAALVRRCSHRLPPVRLDAQLVGGEHVRGVAGDERHRHVGDPLETPLEQVSRPALRPTADVDPSDAGALRELLPRPCECQADENGKGRQQTPDDRSGGERRTIRATAGAAWRARWFGAHRGRGF
jgi:hypothetical protein